MMSMKAVIPPADEIVARGQRVYEEKVRDTLEPAHNGEVAVINIETGEYEVDRKHRAAAKRAHTRWPGGLFYAVRVGYPTLGHIGARLRAKAD